MNATLVATLAGLITALCWGTSDWLTAKSTKNLDTFENSFAVQASSIVIIAVLFIFSGVHLHTAAQLWRIIGANLLISTAYLLFARALASGAVGVVSPLGNAYPLFTIVLSVIFLATHFESIQLVAMVGVVAGTLLLAYEKNTQQLPLRELHKDTALAFAAAVIWGVAFFLLSPIVNQVPWQTISIVGEFVAFLFAGLLIGAVKRRHAVQSVRRALTTSAGLWVGILGTGGFIALYIGSAHAGNIVIPTVLSSTGPLVASLWAAAFDGEKLAKLKRIGALIVVAGIVVLNVA